MHEGRERVVVFSGGGTGGHLYPALALADALRTLRPDVRAVFVGSTRGLEARVLPERGEEHLLLPVVGFARHEPPWRRLRAIPPFLRGLRDVVAELRRLRPEAVVVTGGYAGGPAGLAAVLLRIPLVLQEQNAEPGLVTRVLSPWAREVHLAFPEARERLPKRGRRHAVVSGNPVRASGTRNRERARSGFGLEADGPVVLVVGGSQGSRTLNRLVTEAVGQVARRQLPVPPSLQLLWATGPAHLEEVRAELGASVPDWVHTVGYIEDMPSALTAADVAVSRAGAMATAEFLARGLPSILVPLPSAAAGHQDLNARALEEAGAALRLPEAALRPESLWAAVVALASDEERRAKMARAAEARGRPGAAETIARRIGSFLPEGGEL